MEKEIRAVNTREINLIEQNWTYIAIGDSATERIALHAVALPHTSRRVRVNDRQCLWVELLNNVFNRELAVKGLMTYTLNIYNAREKNIHYTREKCHFEWAIPTLWRNTNHWVMIILSMSYYAKKRPLDTLDHSSQQKRPCSMSHREDYCATKETKRRRSYHLIRFSAIRPTNVLGVGKHVCINMCAEPLQIGIFVADFAFMLALRHSVQRKRKIVNNEFKYFVVWSESINASIVQYKKNQL